MSGSRAIAIPGPVLRREIDSALEETGLPIPVRSMTRADPAWSTDQDRALLTRVLRRVHTAMPAGMFATAIEDLTTEERAHLRALLTDAPADTSSVLKSLPASEARSVESKPGLAPEDVTAVLPSVREGS